MDGSGWKTIGGNTNIYDIYLDRGITYNINDNEALNVTHRSGKHFKSDIINHWSDIDIEEVNVVVYQNGLEQAFLNFNGTGTDKTNWFSQKRMQNSSYSDLKNAIKASTCQPLRHQAEACSTPVQLAYNTYCYKLCDKPLTETDLEEKMQKLEKELSVSRKDTNKFRRSLINAPDNRFSSKTMGLVGAVCIALVVGFIVAVDCINICQKCSKLNKVKPKKDDCKHDKQR
ncbi:unnamed protein product [Mytilus coruscus]|uniref:Uncharacterized protein n=1 Tax=Mytilus coruscus TaxID=42192 RepID=A0A6J8BE85_MYTCO|nr:unnamed protein product [Mytilus coruscus]